MALVPEYVAPLTELSKAASEAMRRAKAKRGPKGGQAGILRLIYLSNTLKWLPGNGDWLLGNRT